MNHVLRHARHIMLPVKRKRKVIFKRQRPLLHTHRTLDGRVVNRPRLADDWNCLPMLVLVSVFKHLGSPADRRSAKLVCHHWSKCMNHPQLWRNTKIHLSTVCKLRSPQWSLLQSRHIVKLSLSALPPSALARILKKLAHTLSDLQSLGIELKRGKNTICYNLNGLSEFCNLRELVVLGSLIPVTFPDLLALQDLVIQDRLEAKFSKMLPNLESLSMIVEHKDTLNLKNFPHLKSLKLTKSGLDCKTFTSVDPHAETPGGRPSFSNIEHLDIAYSRLHMGVKRFFQQFPNLRSLSVAHCSLSEWDLLVIVGNLTQLTELNLTGNETTDAVLSGVTGPLVSLTAQRSAKVTTRGLKGLADCCRHTLASLDLSYCTGVSPSSLAALGVWFSALKTLTLRSWSIPENVSTHLTHFRTIL